MYTWPPQLTNTSHWTPPLSVSTPVTLSFSTSTFSTHTPSITFTPTGTVFKGAVGQWKVLVQYWPWKDYNNLNNDNYYNEHKTVMCLVSHVFDTENACIKSPCWTAPLTNAWARSLGFTDPSLGTQNPPCVGKTDIHNPHGIDVANYKTQTFTRMLYGIDGCTQVCNVRSKICVCDKGIHRYPKN